MLPGMMQTGFYSGVSQTVFTGDLSGVNFATLSVPQTGRLLIVRGQAHSNRIGFTNSSLQLNFNSDNASNYRSQRGVATQSTIAGSFVSTTGSPLLFCPAATSPVDASAIFEVVIPLYAGTNFNKIGLVRWGGRFSTLNSGMNSEVQTFSWLNTAAITTVTAFEGTGSTFASGSYFEIEII